MILFASTFRRQGLAALPRVAKQVILFRFLTPDKRHKWMGVQQFILDPVPGAKEELVSRLRVSGPLPNPKAIRHWGQNFPFGKGVQGSVGIPRLVQLDDWLAPLGPSCPRCPYHPLLMARPALRDTDPMCHV